MKARRSRLGSAARVAALVALVLVAPAYAAEQTPIRIGFGMALTGGLAAAGKSALIAMQIWAEDTNAAGGLLGRPVELVYYDDQSNPAVVPGIYAKLLDIDRVDFIVSGYGTNQIAPALPLAIQRNRIFLALFGIANNEDYGYDRYFQIVPAGPRPREGISKGYFELARAQGLKTVAIV
ncbi:MAG: ABC transporter substrate-binding protein, partial [Gammaproteobacteria bacterium]